MKIYHNELMAQHTTFQIGGTVKELYCPETEQEVIDLIADMQSKKIPYYLLGNGSNVLVSSTGLNRVVVKMEQACKTLEKKGNTVYAGASIRLQEFIRFCVQHGLYGNEFLFSVPASIGGSIYMNAGRGRDYGVSISDYLSSVKIFTGESIIEVPKEECGFGYRKSIFQKKKNWLILGARFTLPLQEQSEGERKITERITFVKKVQDQTAPNAGSIFSDGNKLIFRLIKGFRWGGAQFSKKTSNWINNVESAKSKDVLVLIKLTKLMHRVSFQKIETEIEYWHE